MKENKLTELSMGFSVDIINFVKLLKSNHESIISNQIDKSDFFEWCLPLANDVGFANDVPFGNDVCLAAHYGKQRIIAKRS